MNSITLYMYISNSISKIRPTAVIYFGVSFAIDFNLEVLIYAENRNIDFKLN
jgi:hypothetical protein